MTRYEQGFLTKCAEAGLDEDTSIRLLKTAGRIPWGRIGALAKDVVKRPKAALKRYWQLLRGGNQEIVGDYRKAMGMLDDKATRGIRHGGKSGMKANIAARNLQVDLSRAAHSGGRSGMASNRLGIVGDGNLWFSLNGQAMNLGNAERLGRELRKVYGTRLGTGALAAGGAMYGLSGGDSEQP